MFARYEMGQSAGVYREWYDTGKKLLQIEYVDGKEHGEWIQWYPNGKKEMLVNYTNGVANGKARFWYENGSLQAEGEIVGDTPSGGWILQDAGGVRRNMRSVK